MSGKYIKIVQSGNITEVWEYDNINTKGGGAHRTKEDSEYKEERYERSDRERRNRIRQLATTNFDNKCLFITLTYDENKVDFAKDVLRSNNYFKNFIKRLKYEIGDFKYLAVIEFQDGERLEDKEKATHNIHYHMLIDRKRIEQKILLKAWGAGLIYFEKINHVDNVGAYISKYMCKDMHDKRLMDKKAYLHSTNLKEPNTLKSWDKNNDNYISTLSKLKEKEPIYEKSYISSIPSAQTGEVTNSKISYKQYNNNRVKK